MELVIELDLEIEELEPKLAPQSDIGFLDSVVPAHG